MAEQEFSDEERESILNIIQTEYGLSEDHALELARRAMTELEGSIDFWGFTNLINENYTEDEKMRVVELLWRVVAENTKRDVFQRPVVASLGCKGDISVPLRLKVAQWTARPRISEVSGVRNHGAAEHQHFRVLLRTAPIVVPRDQVDGLGGMESPIVTRHRKAHNWTTVVDGIRSLV